ncbi:hypothetical protein NW767_015563 [Fusarium falciforme]|nr:hypothetical protein NW767_015563 [Fusarium falciforme]
MWTLAALLRAIVPILSLLSSFAFGWGFGYLALSGAIALLPSKEDALVKAQEGLEAEQKVMEIEEWAIEMLNDLQRDSLRSLRALERAMTACDLQGEDNEKALQANNALNCHRRLVEAIMSITKELHGRQQSFNKAKHVSDRIGVIREEAANLDNKEFWMLTAAKVEEEKKAQEEKKEKGEGDDCGCCVIM